MFVIFAIFCVSSYAQQSLPNDFFGLKFEEIYSIEQMKEHIGNNGTFVQEIGTIEMGTTNYKGYVFSNVFHDNRYYPLMTLMTLEHGTFGGIAFTFTNDSVSTDSSLEIIYNEFKDSLVKQYGELQEFPIEEQSDVSDYLQLIIAKKQYGLKPSLHTISNSIGQILFKRGDIRDFYNKPDEPVNVPEDDSNRQLTLW